MSADIHFDENSQTYSYFGTVPAWHKVGQVVSEAQTAQAALKLANLDYTVHKVPVPAGIVNINGKEMTVRDETKYYVLREDTGDVLGTVGSTYTPLQNADAFKFFDNLVSKDEAIYDTAGVLRGGRRVWIAAKMPDYIRVGNEEIEKYVVITNGHDGKWGCSAFLTQVRIVCNNTLTYALNGAKNKVMIPHRANILANIQTAHQVLGISSKYSEEISEIWNQMAKKQVSVSETNDYLLKLFPTNEDSSITTTTDKFREEILGFINSDPTVQTKESRHTVWGLVQAVNGWYEHKKPYKETKQFNVDDVKLTSLWNGSTQKKNQSAFNLALEMI